MFLGTAMDSVEISTAQSLPQIDALVSPGVAENYGRTDDIVEQVRLFVYVHDARLKRNVKRVPISGKCLISLGRGSRCDVILPDCNISRVQMYIGLRDNLCWFEDVGMNRVRVNDRICRPRVRYQIESADTLKIGGYEIRITSSCFDDFSDEVDTLAPEQTVDWRPRSPTKRVKTSSPLLRRPVKRVIARRIIEKTKGK